MSWLYFRPINRIGDYKTSFWEVCSQETDELLGFVEWRNGWRRYTFRPITHTSTWWDPDCMREVADHCERETQRHKEKRKASV